MFNIVTILCQLLDTCIRQQAWQSIPRKSRIAIYPMYQRKILEQAYDGNQPVSK